MKPLVLAGIALFSFTGQAVATGSVMCRSAAEPGVEAYLQISYVASPTVLGAGFSIGDDYRSSFDGNAVPVHVLQSFVGDKEIRVQLSDPNLERIVARLRLVWDEEADEQAMAGVLQVSGAGVYALVCEGP